MHATALVANGADGSSGGSVGQYGVGCGGGVSSVTTSPPPQPPPTPTPLLAAANSTGLVLDPVEAEAARSAVVK